MGTCPGLYLDMSDWPNTIASATASLNIESDPGSLTDFPNIWIDQSENGVLFKLKILQTDQLTPGTSFGQGAKAEQIPTAYLFNLYQADDVRLSSYFAPVTYNGLGINLVIKYLGQGAAGDIQNLVDIKLLRVAEVYLNRAEAYANSGQDVPALADLDALRSNRYSNFSSGNETGAALKSSDRAGKRARIGDGRRSFCRPEKEGTWGSSAPT